MLKSALGPDLSAIVHSFCGNPCHDAVMRELGTMAAHGLWWRLRWRLLPTPMFMVYGVAPASYPLYLNTII